MNWLLLITLAILGIGAVLGWRAGFVKSVFSLVSTIAVIIVTLLLSPIVTGMLKSSETVTDAVYNKLDELINLEFVSDDAGEERNPAEYVDGLSLPKSIKEILKDEIEEVLEGKAEEWEEYTGDRMKQLEAYICEVLTGLILNTIGFVVTLLMTAAGMALLCFVLDVLSRLPVIHQINTFAGAAFGMLESLMLLWIIFVILTMLGSTEFGQKVLTLISENDFLSLLYDNNPIAKLLF